MRAWSALRFPRALPLRALGLPSAWHYVEPWEASRQRQRQRQRQRRPSQQLKLLRPSTIVLGLSTR